MGKLIWALIITNTSLLGLFVVVAKMKNGAYLGSFLQSIQQLRK